MKQSERGGYKGQSWKTLQHIGALGHSRDRIFTDWLDIMLSAHLSATDNIRRNNRDIEKWDGPHEARYMEIVERYASNRPIGERPIDHFTKATAELLLEVEETQSDCLGEIFMREISYGEHGQYFTPEPICDVMASVSMANPIETENGHTPTVGDISGCGSGRMLIAAHKIRPDAFYVGIDLDPRCAKMCALNFLFRGIKGDVYCGNGLTHEMETVWSVRGTWITQHDKPASPATPDEQKQLTLL